MASAVLQFPDEQAIKCYLANEHTLTKADSCMKKNKVLTLAAETFANQVFNPEGVLLNVRLMLVDIKDISDRNREMMYINLSQALIACAKAT